MSGGRLYGVGVGPGDPELITVKARRVIESAPVIAYPGAEHGSSIARRIADPYITPGAIEVGLRYPVTTGSTAHPGGYEGAVSDFYDDCAAQLATHLDAGRDVAVLCEGDPFLYGSYMYLHDRLAHRYVTEVIPGVASFSAAAAAAGTPLVRRDDVLTILPGTLPTEVLAARLQTSDAAVVMKLGRTFDSVRTAVRRAQMLERGIYVERASHASQRVTPLAEVDGDVPYMSLLLVPAERWPRRESPPPGAGSVAVVGLGPGGPDWLTPEAHAEIARADVLIGYDTYLRRVPERHGQRRLASDNRVELQRAHTALELARGGERVVVVSSGDPGIFAMGAAVLEAVEDADTAHAPVAVRIVPGLSAMQAVAARVGAPLGHDFCVISLSDQLKDFATVARRLRAAGEADLVVALYNPASRTRRAQLGEALALLAEHRSPQTPVVVARAVGAAEESVMVTRLDAVDVDAVDMRTLLIVGSSQTRVVDGAATAGLGARVYTPRRYPAPS